MKDASLPEHVSPIAGSVRAQLARAIAELSAAAETVDADPVGTLTTIARVADALNVAAVGMLERVRGTGAIERTTGLPVEMVLRADARAMGWDARALAGAVDVLRRMPRLAEAVAAGCVSWSQARAVVGELRRLDRPTVEAVDAMIGDRVEQLADADPEALLDLVQDTIVGMRADLALAREDRAIESSFLALQARLDGSGGTLFGQADAERFATIANALENAADRPARADDAHAPARAAQRMDALVALCEASLSGGGDCGRPQPRLLVTCDLATLEALGASEAARVLWKLTGGPGRVTPITAQTFACDAEITSIIFKDGQPVGAGDSRPAVPARVRAAVIARDLGCRFPGCRAPVGWSDVHHIVSWLAGGDANMENLVLLCRRCHRRVHRYGWRITVLSDGAFEFRHRGRRLISYARGRPPPRV